jgi:hypothetical protein
LSIDLRVNLGWKLDWLEKTLGLVFWVNSTAMSGWFLGRSSGSWPLELVALDGGLLSGKSGWRGMAAVCGCRWRRVTDGERAVVADSVWQWVWGEMKGRVCWGFLAVWISMRLWGWWDCGYGVWLFWGRRWVEWMHLGFCKERRWVDEN